ncbi:MAG: glycoside hydrolase [Candidatus Dormibacteraeota bacterium]|nr:glycoside hydrolase [Candidatus Dormibacteraeota bacterium]
MVSRRLRTLALFPAALLVVAVAWVQPFHPAVRQASASPLTKLDPRLRSHISGNVQLELDSARPQAQAPTRGSNYVPVNDDGCPVSIGNNVKVNQNCLNIADPSLQGRSQAQNETSIAIDPNNPQHLLASYNDYRRGDGNCGTSYSLDGGRNWIDSTVPTGFTLFDGTREYWQAGGDTSVAWDTRGNAYLSCQVFNRGNPPTTNADLSSAFLMFRSTRNNGGSWNFIGRTTTVAKDVAGGGAILEDKALMTVDNHVGSAFRDRIYVTWTEYVAVPNTLLATAYIYQVHSDDYGETFSDRVLLSTPSSLCPFPLTTRGGCDNNQFSQPFTSPDGTLYVVWSNFNTVDFTVGKPGPARYQVLMARSKDGGATFTAPQRVASYYELPDCPTYQAGQDAGRACVPEKGATTNSIFRATQYPSGAVNPTDPKQVVVSVGSYINQRSKEANGCIPTGSDPVSNGGLYTGVKTPGACNNGILLSTSNDSGSSFTGTATDPRDLTVLKQDRGQRTSDQWFQWLDFFRNGRLAVSYYDRQYGSDETTGFSDFSLTTSDNLTGFDTRRVTTGSSPPPTQFGGVFWGDYTGLAALDRAYPLWSDTRSRELFLCPGTAKPGIPPRLCGLQDPQGPANDQDIFTVRSGQRGGLGGDASQN